MLKRTYLDNYNLDTIELPSLLFVPSDPRAATKCVTDILFDKIYPLTLSIRDRLRSYSGSLAEDEISKAQDVFVLCSSQIKKCLLTLFGIYKQEYNEHTIMQESRQCIMERLSWCINRLHFIDQYISNTQEGSSSDEDNSIFVTPMYFVNWIDHTFDTLSKLSEVVSDYKKSETNCDQWKIQVVDCVCTLHITIDELLLSAMTLCKYCLPADQHIVKARCQVVLRETKALLNELIEGDLDKGFKATPESLKLPIMPSTVNVLIDVIKDVLYVLEANTNTSLLALLIHCFSMSISPVDLIKSHLKTTGDCPCHVKSNDDEECPFVKEFDLYNEKLLQIGSFAVSCSSDQNRILSLRSGLASLEALDPHLVPALMLCPDSGHATLLIESWRHEVKEIRDSVFLIVDPAAFAEKSKQMMHQTLLSLLKDSIYKNSEVCSVINIGCVVHDFFAVYNKHEPVALTHLEKLVPLLTDLNKVQMECKIVSNMLCSENDYKYEIMSNKKNKSVSIEQLLKRLKLLYTLISRINLLLHPKEEEEEFFEEIPLRNVTYNVTKNANTYVNSPKRPLNNFSRSMFARTANVRSSNKKFPLAKLTKHLKAKKNDELSFSVQLDELFNLSEDKARKTQTVVNKNLESLREPSILYDFSPKKRSSLRKAVLNRHCRILPNIVKDNETNSVYSDNGSLVDEATSLQITDILNQMSDITTCLSTQRSTTFNKCITVAKASRDEQTKGENEIPAVLLPPMNVSTYNVRTSNTRLNML